MDNLRAKVFSSLEHIVIKVGTKILVNANGSVNHQRLKGLVTDICRLKEEGRFPVLVSSGAVGLGMGIMGLKTRPKELSLKQACAAAGQIKLMHVYSEKFQARGQKVAQLLLSADDFKNNTRYNNIRRTVQTLLAGDIIPIINENDTVSTEELKVGDNDKLSSDVAHFLEADLLVLLSDEKGLYTGNPKQNRKARCLSVVPKITGPIENMAGGAGNEMSVGGMRAKLRAIKQAAKGGTPVVLTDGKRGGLYDLVQGKKVGTLFLPNEKKLKRRKRWLAFVSSSRGRIQLDKGGVRAMLTGKTSLLAAGVTGTAGSFRVGDFVEICSQAGKIIGRGRTAYSSEEIASIRGAKSAAIPGILKRSGPEEIIHRDNLVIY